MNDDFKPKPFPKELLSTASEESHASHLEMKKIGARIAKEIGFSDVGAGPSSMKTLTAQAPTNKVDARQLLDEFGVNPKAVEFLLNSMGGGQPSEDFVKEMGAPPATSGLWTLHCASFPNGSCGCEITWKGGGMSFPCMA